MPFIRASMWGAATLVSTTLAYGHHSIVGMYDSGVQTTHTGVVKVFHFVNPHPWVVVDVQEPTGGTVSWRLELDNRYELASIGMTEQTLRPGDRVVVSGSPGRDGAKTLYVRRLERPADGLRYEQIGMSPRLTRGRE